MNKAIPETESLVIRGLKPESKVRKINFGTLTNIPAKNN